MKHLLTWIWHGENFGTRTMRGLIAASAYATGKGRMPGSSVEWLEMLTAFVLGAAVSKSEKNARKLGRKA